MIKLEKDEGAETPKKAVAKKAPNKVASAETASKTAAAKKAPNKVASAVTASKTAAVKKAPNKVASAVTASKTAVAKKAPNKVASAVTASKTAAVKKTPNKVASAVTASKTVAVKKTPKETVPAENTSQAVDAVKEEAEQILVVQQEPLATGESAGVILDEKSPEVGSQKDTATVAGKTEVAAVVFPLNAQMNGNGQEAQTAPANAGEQEAQIVPVELPLDAPANGSEQEVQIASANADEQEAQAAQIVLPLNMQMTANEQAPQGGTLNSVLNFEEREMQSPQQMEVILETHSLKKLYRNVRKGMKNGLLALSDLTFSVCAGEVVGFLGPNGAGKSTAIKLITGLAKMTAGSAKIMGHDVVRERKKALSYVGGVIEQPDLYQNMTGQQLLKYFSHLYPKECFADESSSLSKKELIDLRIEKLLRLVGLVSKRDELIKKYSLGMKQRLGIAQALLSKPRLLLLDEPANGLDPAGIKEIRDIIVYLAKEMNMAVLVSSHQLAEMQLMCDRVIILNKGVKVAEGKIEDLLEGVSKKRIRIQTAEPKRAAALFFSQGIGVVEEAGGVVLTGNITAGDAAKAVVLAGINLQGVQEVGGNLEDLYFSLTKKGGDL